MEDNILITDGFVWLVLDTIQAQKFYEAGLIQLFGMDDNGNESAIESDTELSESIANGWLICIEVGQIPEQDGINYWPKGK